MMCAHAVLYTLFKKMCFIFNAARLRFERRRASLHAGKHFRLAEFYEEHVDAAKSGTFKSTTGDHFQFKD